MANSKLERIAETAGHLVRKVLYFGMLLARDLGHELRYINQIRKDTIATAEAGIAKKELTKRFWTKLTGKQKGIVTLALALLLYGGYALLLRPSSQYGMSESYSVRCGMNKLVNNGTGSYVLLQQTVYLDVHTARDVVRVDWPKNDGQVDHFAYRLKAAEKHVKGTLFSFEPTTLGDAAEGIKLFTNTDTKQLTLLYLLPGNMLFEGQCQSR